MIHPANPKAQRRVIAATVAVGFLFAAMYVLLEHVLADLRVRPASEAGPILAMLLRWGTASASAIFATFGVYLFFFGHRVAKTHRFPPKETVMMRDTVVLEGNRARVRGLLIQWLAAVLIVAAVALSVAAFRVSVLLATTYPITNQLHAA
jgi:hypothetical protein